MDTSCGHTKGTGPWPNCWMGKRCNSNVLSEAQANAERVRAIEAELTETAIQRVELEEKMDLLADRAYDLHKAVGIVSVMVSGFILGVSCTCRQIELKK